MEMSRFPTMRNKPFLTQFANCSFNRLFTLGGALERQTTSKLVFFALLLCSFLTSCVGKQEIVSDIGEKEANEIIVFLAGHGIPADKKAQSTTAAGGGGEVTFYSITVPSNQAVEALSILNRNGLPRRPGSNLLTIFAKSGLVSSAQEEQIRYQEGLSTQIAGVIRKIDGVIDADVQISFPATEAQPGASPEEVQGEVRASVYVKHSGILDDPNSQLVNKIKRLVAGSVVGLTFDNVTVVTDRARFTEVGFSGMPEGSGEREYERIWSIVMTKGSVGRFQALFSILCIVIVILALALGWLIWKIFPMMQKENRWKSLFTSWRPFMPLGTTTETPSAESREEE